ncbi:uncharacterized protein LOC121389544 isoform X2 [Gigantopelta aegis]|uniref:uncharacterized protein LOC121389544 isoform X2 n=1 Tax=Gigantopelta aegis TaxID=1735272 RepID=UPI001B888D05|nr:uncharacterized protein LOC121389544 isoform X2 [Gigantopelta aegis]
MYGVHRPLSLLLALTHILALENGINKGTSSCKKTKKNIFIRTEKGDYGHIASQNYPDAYSSQMYNGLWCEFRIRACSTCKIRLKFTDLEFPECNITKSEHQIYNHDSCIPGCDHLYLYEMDHPYRSISYSSYFSHSMGETYESISAHLKLVHCLSNSTLVAGKKFKIKYDILDKNEFRQGMVAQYGKHIGTVTSPNFPHGYAMNGETFTYMIQNLDPYGHVRLKFDDWDVAPQSRVKIYDGLSANSPSVVMERGKRLVMVSDSNTIVIVFDTGTKTDGCCDFAGFKASYQFVSEKEWPDKPRTDCSATHPMRSGGMIDFTGERSTQPHFYDCIWVIKRYHHGDNIPDGVVLRMREVLLGDGWLQYGKINTLDIRYGTTSAGKLLHRYTAKNLTYAEPYFTSGDGLYIHLQGGFYSTDKLSFIFTAVKNLTDEGCPGYFEYLCQNLYCIDQELMCDGIDHCGDNSDENPALDCSVSALWRLSFKWSMPYVDMTSASPPPCHNGFMCRNQIECLPMHRQCDGIIDCQDHSDEYGCYYPTTYRSRSSEVRCVFIPVFLLTLSIVLFNHR